MTNRKIRAFTLIELLVVISIIGMLLALLVPAVSSALQAAKQNTCMNNQREVGIALKLYAADFNRYPGYRQWIGTPIEANVSWCVAILPQLGHNDIYDQLTGPDPVRGPGNPLARPARVSNIKVLLSPVDGQDYSSGPWLSYVINGGQSDTVEAQSGVPTSRRRAQGICHNLTLPEGRQLYVDDGFIQSHDGTSKTILMSQNNGAFQWCGDWSGAVGSTWVPPEEYLLCFLWAKGEASTVRMPVNQISPSGVIIPIGKANDATEARLTSNHPAGVLALFADGHVQFLGDRLDNGIYRHLCTPWGAQADDTPKQTVISDTDLAF